MKIPKKILLGTGTAAYQVEGAWNKDGKGPSQWDTFTHEFKLKGNETGDIASYSYHKYGEDIELLQKLGVNFYRMSISWSRILPKAFPNRNSLNWTGVNYYLKILKKLKELKIIAVVTLYYLDLPDVLNQLGGWTNPFMVEWFGDYANLCFELFGEYVQHWIPLNDPAATCYNGFIPNLTIAPEPFWPGKYEFFCSYVMIMAHARAYHIYRDKFYKEQKGKIGFSTNNFWMVPCKTQIGKVPLQSDVYAATRTARAFRVGNFLHPLIKGDWHYLVVEIMDQSSEKSGNKRSRLPKLNREEINYLKGTVDFIAINYYFTLQVHIKPDNWPVEMESSEAYHLDSKEILPRHLESLVKYIECNFGKLPLFITENGFISEDKSLIDVERIQYIRGHLCELIKLFNKRYNIIGYTQWPLLDGFHWQHGYSLY